MEEEKKGFYSLENFGCMKDCEVCPFTEECKDCGKYGEPEKNCDGDCKNCSIGCAEGVKWEEVKEEK